MTETPPEYISKRSPYQPPALAEKNSLITKLLNAKDETSDRKVKKSKLSKYYESR